MKRTITAILGFALIAASATLAQAQNAGDDIFFSASATDPGATVGNASFSISTLGTQTLYVWVTMAAGGADDVTPPDTGFTNGFPNTGAGLAVNYNSSTTSVATLTGASMLNPTISGAIKRWDNTTTFSSSGTGQIYNVNAVTVPVVAPAGLNRGLSQNNAAGGVGPGVDPNVVAHAYSNGATQAFLLGSVSINVLGAGSTTVAVQPSNQAANSGSGIPAGLQIAKGQSGSGTSTIMTNFFTYHTANVTVATGRLGDFNNDGAVNAADIDIISTNIRTSTTNVATEDISGPTVGVPDGVVNKTDLDYEVGHLADINGGGVGGAHGTHYGDADLNGTVSFGDYQTLLLNFNQSGKGWAQGDFTGPGGIPDGVVGFGDYQTLLLNFGLSGPAIPAPLPGAAVPEPASLALCGIGLVGLLGIRRRFSCS